MAKDAESHRDEDKKRREVVELRNRAEATIYEADKSLKEHGSKISDADREAIAAAKKTLEEALKGEDKDAIEAALSGFQAALQKIGEVLYAEAAKKAGSGAPARRGGAEAKANEGSGNREDVQDAEFEVKS